MEKNSKHLSGIRAKCYKALKDTRKQLDQQAKIRAEQQAKIKKEQEQKNLSLNATKNTKYFLDEE